VVVAGCGFPADTAGRRYRCEAGDPCPDGTTCVAGYCEQNEPVVDGGGGDVTDGASTEVCGGGQLIAREEFDELDDEVWYDWSNGDANVFAAGGALVVSSAVGSNAGIISAAPAALPHLMVSVEVGTRSSGGVGSLAGLQIMTVEGGDTIVSLERGDDELRAMLYPNDVDPDVLGRIDFDAEAHRFWRIVTTDDDATFEYSSDEAAWHELASRTIADLPDVVKPQLQSGSYGGVGQDQEFDLLTVCRLP
jgi:hypothetical protein